MPVAAPAYQRPFTATDFVGYFTWTKQTTELFSRKRIWHACHRKQLERFLLRGKLTLRSKCEFELPVIENWTVKSVWVGMRSYSDRNFYGPFQIQLPVSVLNGRRFAAFRREDEKDRQRLFLFQYEAEIPIFRFKKNPWRTVKPETLLKESDSDTVWELVLTAAVSLAQARIRPTGHPHCISKRCGGSTTGTNRKVLDSVIQAEFQRRFTKCPEYLRFAELFPNAEGLTVTLPELEDE